MNIRIARFRRVTFIAATLALAAGCAQGATSGNQTPDAATPQRLEIGHLRARALLQCAAGATADAPMAIVIPGSGGHGPEEAMPGSITRDGQETEILSSFAQGLRAAGFHSLQLGKPGIEFHTTWEDSKIAYDKDLYMRLTWKDLLESVNEAIDYVTAQRPCGASTIVLAGHSEGTMRITDVANANPKVRGLVFLGFEGHGFKDVVDWQAYGRSIEFFVRPDVDTNHDAFISRDEASRWPDEFSYAWKDGETQVSIAAYAEQLRADPATKKAIADLAATPLFSNGFWEREPIFRDVAQLSIPVLAFTGSLDVVTPPREIQELDATCKQMEKLDCETHVVPGVGHGFSGPKPPREHPFLDMTEGPVDPHFLELFAERLKVWRAGIRPHGSHP